MLSAFTFMTIPPVPLTTTLGSTVSGGLFSSSPLRSPSLNDTPNSPRLSTITTGSSGISSLPAFSSFIVNSPPQTASSAFAGASVSIVSVGASSARLSSPGNLSASFSSRTSCFTVTASSTSISFSSS
ncbi:unnamed protein product, partial [Ixodes hexagonus]